MKSEQLKTKEVFIERMEELLLVNMLLPGERLPSERQLAQQMGVSRPLIHEGLLELASRGLIQKRARHGWVVNDFSKEGAIPLLNSLYRFAHSSSMTSKIDGDLEQVRQILLSESLKNYFSQSEIPEGKIPKGKKGPNPKELFVKEKAGELEEKLYALIDGFEQQEDSVDFDWADFPKMAEDDFLFYRTIIEAGGNIVFLLLFNSARELYHKKLESFFQSNQKNLFRAYQMKKELVTLIAQKETIKALNLIERMTSYSSYPLNEE